MFKVNHKGKSRLQWDKVQDSGTRTAFGTGSQRDTQEGKGRYDLIPTSVLHRLAVHYENGAAKYGDNNWQKGQSLAQYYNSAMRHLNAIRDADLSEDHFAAAIWNVAAMIHHIDAMIDGQLPTSLDSFGIIEKVVQHQKAEHEERMTSGIPEFKLASNPLPPYREGDRVRFVASGVAADVDDPFQPLVSYDATAYDKERFKAGLGIRRFKTTQLTEDD